MLPTEVRRATRTRRSRTFTKRISATSCCSAKAEEPAGVLVLSARSAGAAAHALAEMFARACCPRGHLETIVPLPSPQAVEPGRRGCISRGAIICCASRASCSVRSTAASSISTATSIPASRPGIARSSTITAPSSCTTAAVSDAGQRSSRRGLDRAARGRPHSPGPARPGDAFPGQDRCPPVVRRGP